MSDNALLTKDEKRKKREAKELSRLLKQKGKPKFIGYAFFFLFVITLVYLTDEISTNIGKFLELDVTSFFFKGVAEDSASSTRSLVTTLVTVIAGLSMFLRPLADRFGRKIFLVIYTIGMGVGMGIIALANGVAGWVVGTLMIQMCIPHDMQQIYIQECAPKEKRGTYFFVIKGIATIGLMVVPLIRYATNGITNNFKIVYGIVAVLGIVSAVLGAIFMRESDVYIDSRINQLQMSDEERARIKQEKKDDAKRGGMIAGIAYVFKHSQLRWITISFMLIMLSYVLTDNYNTTMAVGLLTQKGLPITAENYASPDVMNFTNNAILTYPVGCGLALLLPGFVSDKIGRKKTALVFGTLALVLYVLFFVGSKFVWNPFALGLLIGAACGAVWSCGDLVLLMVTESSSTNLRASANAAVLLICGIVYAIGMAVVGAIGSATGDINLPYVTIGAVTFGLTIGLILLFILVKETKGTDLDSVRPDDFKETAKVE